jgi:hypothetical protein
MGRGILPEFTLTYEDTPPSFNAVGHSGSRWSWTKAKKTWQKTMEDLLQVEAVPRRLGRIEARAVLTFTSRRRRDAVNYRTLLEKALGDALVNGGWLEDDTGAEFSFGSVTFEVGPRPQTLLVLAAFPYESDGNSVTPPRCNPQDGTSPPPRRIRRPPRG